MSVPRRPVSQIALKLWVAVTGLFLVLFLTVHVLGNLQLFLPASIAQTSYNAYSEALSHNPIIQVAALVTYTSIIVHAAVSLTLSLRNRAKRAYVVEHANESSPWYARKMELLGAILLGFLGLHMWSFWKPFKFGPIALDTDGKKDLYGLVSQSFSQPIVVIVYVLSMLALGFHLQHGLSAAFRSLGLYHARADGLIRRVAPTLAWTFAGLFAAMPLYLLATLATRGAP